MIGFFVFEQKRARFSKLAFSFFERQVPVGIGCESPAIRFTSLRSCPLLSGLDYLGSPFYLKPLPVQAGDSRGSPWFFIRAKANGGTAIAQGLLYLLSEQ
ncbi:hypothetical protein [Pedobacter sp. KLB.chiD]|uniref:hypothetical protein n=1 Tax=Pedobacter sp. KLB.chiD TaxID=3387402 RepID=UPI003999F42E